MSTAMRALVGGRGPDWELEQRPAPEPVAGTVRVRIVAAGINRADVLKLHGGYGDSPTPGEYIAGMEFSGTVDTADPNTPQFPVGSPVMVTTVGAFADYALCLPGLLLPVPDGLPLTQAAALPTGLITEHDALVTQAGFTAGQSVLIVGATTAVGLVGVQLAVALGATTVITTTTSEEKRSVLRDFGASVTVNTATDSLAEVVREATNGLGVDICVDHVGGALFTHLTAATRIGGTIINIGRLAGREASINLDELSFRRQHLIGTTFSARTPEEVAEVFSALQPRSPRPSPMAGSRYRSTAHTPTKNVSMPRRDCGPTNRWARSS